MNPKETATKLLHWYDENKRILPWRQNRTAYTTWISETMLQQTRVTTVIPYYHRFLEAFPDIESLAASPLDTLYKIWEGLGYYSRAKNLRNGANYCLLHHNGQLPDTLLELLTVPGIGPYTAGAIASMAYGLAVPAIDGNVMRVFSRYLGLAITTQDVGGRKQIGSLLQHILPTDRPGDFNEAIMDLGSGVCTPKNPKCGRCPLSDTCNAFAFSMQNTLPLKRAKKEIPHKPYTILIFEQNGQVLLRQRPATGLLANLYEFASHPTLIYIEKLRGFLSDSLGLRDSDIERIDNLGPSIHVFSHLQWDMQGYRIILKENAQLASSSSLIDLSGTQLVTIEEARKLAFPSAIRAYTAEINR